MRYLLVAPYAGRDRSAAREARWTPIASDGAPPPGADGIVDHRESARVHGVDVLFVIVTTSGADASVEDLERRLHRLATYAARGTRRGGDETLRWVSRIHLPADADDHEVWPASQRRTADLGDGGEFAIGWGSGRIDGWDHLVDAVRRDVLTGLAQAQALWCELADLTDRSAGEISRVYAEGSRVDADRTLERLANLNAQLQLHTLSWGELSRGVRARPREVARAALDAWDYSRLRAQLDSDITAAMSHAQVLERLAGARYQRAVEVVLLALTIVSALGLVIALIDLAYTVSGAGSSDGAVLGFLDAVRAADANIVLVLSGLALLTVMGVLLLSRRRGGARA